MKLKNRISRFLLVLRHARSMWRQLTLPKNAAKGDWRGEDVRDLLELAKQEYEELFVACWEFEHGKGSAERVAEEAADLSNFAAMIADKARRNERG